MYELVMVKGGFSFTTQLKRHLKSFESHLNWTLMRVKLVCKHIIQHNIVTSELVTGAALA